MLQSFIKIAKNFFALKLLIFQCATYNIHYKLLSDSTLRKNLVVGWGAALSESVLFTQKQQLRVTQASSPLTNPSLQPTGSGHQPGKHSLLVSPQRGHSGGWG